MSIAPHTGIVDFGTFTAPTASKDGIQGEVPMPLAGQEAYVLTATGWAPGGGGGGGSGTVTSINVSGGTTGLTTSGGPVTTSGTITLAGTLAVANGGTGVTSSSGANSVVLRDANGNITTNCLFEGFTSQAASGTTIVLTAASVQNFQITGSGGQIIRLPNATTLPNGALFTFNNNQSSGAITVQNNSSTTVATINSGGYVTVSLLDNTTAAGSWDRHDQTPANVSWSTNTFDYPGSFTSGTWNGNVVAYNRGGTGQSAAFVAGGIVYGSTTSALAVTSIGTSGQVLTSAGAGTPTWTTPTTGTVTSVGGTGTVNGLTLTGTVTSSGNLTLGGTLDLSSPPAIGGTTASTGSFTIVTSTIATGTAPFTVASTTPVTNLSIGGNAATATNVAYSGLTGTVPTWNQNTTGSAATLTTARAIYGNNFDGSAALTQIIASTYGGTGNGFTKFSGATTTEKTYTLPDATTTILTTNAAVTGGQGGTGQTTYANGDLLYGVSTNTLSKLTLGTSGYFLTAGASAPQWTQTLPIANGGTGQTGKTAAFDALSPTTTKGDLIVNNGTNNIRIPVGTDTYVLTADSTQASGLTWAAASGGGLTQAQALKLVSLRL